MQKEKSLTMDVILASDPVELAEEIIGKFHMEVPQYIETADELNQAQYIISRSISNYSYLDSMAKMLKIFKRNRKRDGADKKEIEDILSKEEIFTRLAEQCKLTYQATSRMITVRQMILEELHMSDTR